MAAKPIETLGFVGLGVMGERMCANLVAKSGKPVFGADTRRAPVERLAPKGLKPCGSIAEVARAAHVVFLSLPSIAEVEDVCFGAGGFVETSGCTHTIVDMSTSSVSQTRQTICDGKQCRPAGGTYQKRKAEK